MPLKRERKKITADRKRERRRGSCQRTTSAHYFIEGRREDRDEPMASSRENRNIKETRGEKRLLLARKRRVTGLELSLQSTLWILGLDGAGRRSADCNFRLGRFKHPDEDPLWLDILMRWAVDEDFMATDFKTLQGKPDYRFAFFPFFVFFSLSFSYDSYCCSFILIKISDRSWLSVNRDDAL